MWEKVVAYFPDAYFMPLLAKLRANRVQSTVSLRLFRYGVRAAVPVMSLFCGNFFGYSWVTSMKPYEYQPLACSRPQCSVGLCLPPAQFLRK